MTEAVADAPLISKSGDNAIGHIAGNYLLVAETAGIFSLGSAEASRLEMAMSHGDLSAGLELARLGINPIGPADPPNEAMQPVRALALTISQACNLACGYCYAGGGSFGGANTRMSWDVAKSAIDRLIADAVPGGAVKIAFMGGEPMVARRLMRRAVDHANRRAAARAISIGYSLTTNGTLLTEEDALFFARHRFAVTLSLDGGREVNDRLRPSRAGSGSFDRVAAGIAPLLTHKDRISLSARVTVTPQNLDLPKVVSDVAALGFETVGVSPMITSPTGQGALAGEDFARLLSAMIACGDEWMAATLAGQHHAFANLPTVLGELHRGKPRSHGCGAVRDYLAVDAEGRYAACHRFVRDPLGAMGDLESGIDHYARTTFLAERTVERQSPCRTCWARRLCGGGCHQEVLHAGRPACDFVRGWLDYGLRCFGQMMSEKPGWFEINA